MAYLYWESCEKGVGMWAVYARMCCWGRWAPHARVMDLPKGCWAARLAAARSSVTAPVGAGLCPALVTDGARAL